MNWNLWRFLFLLDLSLSHHTPICHYAPFRFCVSTLHFTAQFWSVLACPPFLLVCFSPLYHFLFFSFPFSTIGQSSEAANALLWAFKHACTTTTTTAGYSRSSNSVCATIHLLHPDHVSGRPVRRKRRRRRISSKNEEETDMGTKTSTKKKTSQSAEEEEKNGYGGQVRSLCPSSPLSTRCRVNPFARWRAIQVLFPPPCRDPSGSTDYFTTVLAHTSWIGWTCVSVWSGPHCFPNGWMRQREGDKKSCIYESRSRSSQKKKYK